jgi:hypothetical protein
MTSYQPNATGTVNWPLTTSDITTVSGPVSFLDHQEPPQPLYETQNEDSTMLQMKLQLRHFIQDRPVEPMEHPSMEEECRYLNHYKTFMRSSFTFKRGSGISWNYHTFMSRFMDRCPNILPLRNAVIAWSAFHLSIYHQSAEPACKFYYHAAWNALDDLMSGRKKLSAEEMTELKMSGPGIQKPMEMIIVSMLFLSRCSVLAHCIDSLTKNLLQVHDWLNSMDKPLEISGFAFRLLFWLAVLHVRISIFMIEPTAKGTIFRVIERQPGLTSLRRRANLYLAEVFGDAYPQTELARDIDLMSSRNLNFENMSLMNKVIEYRSWRASPGGVNPELDVAKQETLRSEMRRLQAEYRLAIVTNPAPNEMLAGLHIPPLSYAVDWQLNHINLHWLTNYGTFKTFQVIVGRVLNPDSRIDPETAAAVAEILHIALKLRSKKDHRITRSFAWPLPLFVAGIETLDDVYADWVLRFMEEAEARSSDSRGKDGGGMSGGTGGPRVRWLIEQVRLRQLSSGNRVDVHSVIKELRGLEAVVIF